MAANLGWRKGLREQCENHPSIRRGVLASCRDSFLYWVNAFGFTYRQRFILPDGSTVPVTGHKAHVPMITWQVQDEAAEKIISGIRSGYGLNGEKSRDMGATWLVLFIFDWFFLFHEEQNFGVVSRKEMLVDSKGDMDSLFEKLRYVHNMLPKWMVPNMSSRYMHLRNKECNSTIAGESTNTDVGRGGRKIAYLVDEAAAIDNGSEIENSLSQNTSCQVWISTPKGPNTQFHRRIKEKRGETFQLPWYRHPEKAVGAKQVFDEFGRVRWTSPWYEYQVRTMSRKAVAQEIDCDHGQAGDMFFEHREIERHRRDHMASPVMRGDLAPITEMTEEDRLRVIRTFDYDQFVFINMHRRAPWRFWCRLEDGRPPQHAQYVFGVDIANGAGSSNSVVSVLDVMSGKIVAKWWDAYTSPETLAILVATAGVWFGGLRPPAYVVHENNGPGGIFGRKMVKIGYPSIYYQRTETRSNKRTERWGFHTSKQSKEVLLGLYRDALAKDDIVNPCEESLDEAEDYIYSETGLLIPSILREESSGGRELHGDHVVADALTVIGRDEQGKHREVAIRPRQGTFAYRRQKRKRMARRQREEESWR
jgi:hypothetical protein